MPAIGPDSHVLVTGASGFIAVWCCHQLLERGHRVRGTVRSQEKGEYLAALFQRFGDKFSFVIAEDLEKPGVFDEAVKGVDGVLHTASPFHFNIDGDPLGKLIQPAVNGTRSVLRSIKDHGTDVKRVVVTSSFAAILDSTRPVPTAFDEKDWNESSPANVDKLGNKQDGTDAYRASKTLAERAAWDFVEAEKPQWDLATINPPLVLGPLLHQVKSPESLNTSAGMVWKIWHGGFTNDELPGPRGAVVDVRDVAAGHVQALLRADAAGQRFATTSGGLTWQAVCDITHASNSIPQQYKDSTPVGNPGQKVVQHTLDGSKAARVLGIDYYTLHETINDMATSFADYEKRNFQGHPGEHIASLGKKA
ncbi:uncharacterized protein PFL1_04728 [Pseudozyma flocculosa PF-1]|uniref:Related to GRE2 - methylglyoxal reductase (NADPH-dependent) n=2 Tax=Pseudozyma flocculosa TaxID=84751 RepID=A0A5C3F452_9BASI|nr:uncharacterized protein PFL1_04728 [Pseudozyma flocculosa PF-1]EPQ27590.1 hypothetical protein PFL1_04728 [Pseudozyma flocculosa PF-1]SPO39283.1 related to GRE2 - methylglyoxal reductase (NADPH-dependent) [Pseudozyma flocculosa]